MSRRLLIKWSEVRILYGAPCKKQSEINLVVFLYDSFNKLQANKTNLRCYKFLLRNLEFLTKIMV